MAPALASQFVGDLYVELVKTFDLKRHTCNNLAVEEVIGAARIYKNGDGLLFKESSNFHRLRVGVTGQRVHYMVGRLGLFLRGFIFEFEVFFKWYGILILYWFDHEEPMVADICRKMAAKRSESEGSSDDGGRRGQQQRRLWLHCDFVAASGISCSKGAAAIGGRWAVVCTAIAEEGSSGMEREMAAVVFNLLLAAIKIVGSE
ncbi:hypothetical protein B296_00031941 [Ensete ventricosum]|uniref:Uncharacterized protein n=1 Tax=Ensete ventricosum TaxID=4639 RepID=A0A426XE14_ENSVE|nr:hypothetical protein B296_00031941 [Ensete ventricosum]